MKDIFEMMTVTDKEKQDETKIRLGICLKIGDTETICPISGICDSYDAFEVEVEAVKNNLERVINKAKEIFSGSSLQKTLELKADMAPEKIWSILSSVDDEDLFVNSFNALDEVKRKEVAEYVLTQCNIFSGKALVFSERYKSELGFME